MSELPTASLGMRTHVANATVSKSVHRLETKKEGLPQGKSFFFGRSGGTRTHGLQYPNKYTIVFLTTFIDFLMLFSPKTMLSDALVRTVST